MFLQSIIDEGTKSNISVDWSDDYAKPFFTGTFYQGFICKTMQKFEKQIFVDCIFGTQNDIPEPELSMKDLRIRFKEHIEILYKYRPKHQCVELTSQGNNTPIY